jgi:hypothetical protein
LVLVASFAFLLLELISGNYQSFYAEVFLLAVAFGAVLWVGKLSLGIIQKKRWARSAAFFWQLLQGAVGANALGSNLPLGIFLVALSLVLILILFNKRVVDLTNEESEN